MSFKSQISDTLDPAHLSIITLEYYFYAALCFTQLYDESSLPAEFFELQKKIAFFAELCPSNFSQQDALISAEIARVRGHNLEAIDFYERAIELCKRNSLIHHEAVAFELAARFYLNRKFLTSGYAYMREARYCYLRWGAHAKVQQLDGLYPQLVEVTAGPSGTTFIADVKQIDMISVLKASQAISKDLVLGRFLNDLMQIMLEYAGARKGYLILPHDGKFSIEAQGDFGQEEIKIQSVKPRPIEDEKNLPVSVINYVIRTLERVLLDDAKTTSIFSSDPYLSKVRPKSVLCLPIIRQGKLLAALYLDNSLISGAFTSDRLSILELLAAQAAISLENARLYSEAQEAIHLREEFLVVAAHEFRTPLTPLRLQIQTLKRLSDRDLLKQYPKEKLDSMLEMSDRRLTGLSSKIEELLDASRLSMRNLSLHFETVNLLEQIREELLIHQDEIASSKSTVEVFAQEPIIGNWDRFRLEQVIGNLLSNAIKYGGGKAIQITTRLEGCHAVIQVQDHGIGIREEDQKKIFDRFERAVSSEKFSGWGLGLYIVRQIVEAHQGEVHVQSKLGEGSTFTVTLPLFPQTSEGVGLTYADNWMHK